jgi:hypothetical protein
MSAATNALLLNVEIESTSHLRETPARDYHIDQSEKLRGTSRLDRDPPPLRGVIEGERPGVEQEARSGNQSASLRLEVADVDSLPYQRMSAFGEVDADLMGAPGLEPDLAETRALEPSQNANVG